METINFWMDVLIIVFSFIMYCLISSIIFGWIDQIGKGK